MNTQEIDVVAIGGSAGSLEPLTTLLSGLPSSFSAAILVVVHVPADGKSVLPEILSRVTPLIVRHAVNGEPLLRGRVYIAPPNYHLLVRPGVVEVMQGPHENAFRPAIDPLFRSVAQIYQSRAAGVVLSGALDDGTFGLHAIKQAGGVALVQHPYEATTPSMPLSAIQNVEVDYIVPCKEIARLLLSLTSPNVADQAIAVADADADADADVDARNVLLQGVAPDRLMTIQGPPTIYSCPECGGTLWEHQEGGHFRFRCHTGHGFTPETLLSQQNGELELALWTAIRVLQERSALHRRMADTCEEKGMESTARQFTDRATDEFQKANVLRTFVGGNDASRPPIVPPKA